MKKGWEWKKLGDICTFQRGLTYSKKDEVELSSNIVLRATNIDLRTNTLDLTDLKYVNESVHVPPDKKVREGGLLVCMASGSKSHLGKVALIDKCYDFAFGGFMGQLLCREMVVPKFVYYAMTGTEYLAFIAGLSDGANINNLRFDVLATFRIPIPPLPEQRRIVGILEEAFAGLATAEANAARNLQNAREIFDSHLHAVFSQRGEGWVERRLDDICEISSALVDPRESSLCKLTHVGAGNIQSQTGCLVDLKTAEEEGLISGKFLFDDSAVLYSKIRPYLMKVARPTFRGLCSADMYPLSPNPGMVNRDFLFYTLLTKHFTEYAVAGSARAGMPKVNRDHLFAYKVFLPPVGVQAALARVLDSLREQVNSLSGMYEQKQSALTELKKSLLHEAFSGKL